MLAKLKSLQEKTAANVPVCRGVGLEAFKWILADDASTSQEGGMCMESASRIAAAFGLNVRDGRRESSISKSSVETRNVGESHIEVLDGNLR